VGIYDDPQNPLTPEDMELVQQITEQGALALESARLFEQTQVALDEARVLYEAGRRVSSATTPQEMLAAVAEGVPVSAIDRALLWELEYSITNEPEAFIVIGNWRRDESIQPLPVGTRFVLKQFPVANLAVANDPVFMEDVTSDERVAPMTRAVFQHQRARGLALLPLWAGNRQVGLAMLVSEQPHRFAEKEIRPYTSLARQVAVALENRRLFDQTRAALEEVEATQRRYMSQQWETYLASARGADKPLSFVDSPLGITANNDMWLPEMDQALEVGEPILVGPDGGSQRSALAVPLKLRGEPIGVIEFYEEGVQREWSDDERVLVQSLADQAVLALENARLFEETQGRAQREQLINQITARVRSSTDMQTILRTTTEELTRVLDLPWARIRLTSAGNGGNGQAG
jgi:GAF domain-containing protein